MKSFKNWTATAVSLCIASIACAQIDSSPHKVQFVSVERNVKLEVLDWGGTGQPLILLPGLGDTAHVFDSFALKLIPNHHVLSITPRGFGSSSRPPPEPANYSADRLGNDVVAVIDALRLDRPILAGHSVAGEVLSAVAASHPDKVSALVYIDAGYPYALYDKAHGDLVLDSITLRNELNELHIGTLPRAPKQVDELLIEVQKVEEELQQRKEDLSQLSQPNPIDNSISVAVLDGQREYTRIDLPVLAIFNVPHSPVFRRTMEDQAKAFETQVPHAQIVRIANADHYIFRSNEADVVQDINVFVKSLQNKD